MGSTYFYIENDGQNITFFIFKNLSKTLYFREKNSHNLFIFSPISNPFESYDSSFHFTCYQRKKISKKYFRQVYRGCQTAKKIVRAHSHGNNSKSIALRIIQNNSVRSWRRRLKKQKTKKKELDHSSASEAQSCAHDFHAPLPH